MLSILKLTFLFILHVSFLAFVRSDAFIAILVKFRAAFLGWREGLPGSRIIVLRKRDRNHSSFQFCLSGGRGGGGGGGIA